MKQKPVTMRLSASNYGKLSFQFGDMLTNEAMVVRVEESQCGCTVTTIKHKTFKYKIFHRIWYNWIKLKVWLNIL